MGIGIRREVYLIKMKKKLSFSRLTSLHRFHALMTTFKPAPCSSNLDVLLFADKSAQFHFPLLYLIISFTCIFSSRPSFSTLLTAQRHLQLYIFSTPQQFQPLSSSWDKSFLQPLTSTTPTSVQTKMDQKVNGIGSLDKILITTSIIRDTSLSTVKANVHMSQKLLKTRTFGKPNLITPSAING